MRVWRKRAEDVVALRVRPLRTVTAGINEVFVQEKDGEVINYHCLENHLRPLQSRANQRIDSLSGVH